MGATRRVCCVYAVYLVMVLLGVSVMYRSEHSAAATITTWTFFGATSALVTVYVALSYRYRNAEISRDVKQMEAAVQESAENKAMDSTKETPAVVVVDDEESETPKQ